MTGRTVLLIVAAVCGYEAAALVWGRMPTITALSRRSMLFRAFVLAGLAYHFRRAPVVPCPQSVGRRAT